MDVLILVLRIALVVLLYLFLAFVVRSALRALKTPAPAPAPAVVPRAPVREDRSKLRLLVQQPGGSELRAGQVVVVDDGVLLGRGERAGVVLADPAVSAEHARLVRVDGAWVVMDLGSTNGTLLNQRAVHGQARLQAGDELGLGNVRLKVVGH